MRSIGRDPAMPECRTLFRWLRTHDEFRQQYTLAKEESADAYSEDIVDIADNLTDAQGKLITEADNVAVNHARLRIEARKWTASKLKPKKYGDKVTQEHTGANGGAITLITQEMSDDEAARIYSENLAKLRSK